MTLGQRTVCSGSRSPVAMVTSRETVTLDHLSNGRLTLGVGLGIGDDLEPFGEAVDPRERGRLLDEGLDRLGGFWSGGFRPLRCSARGSRSGSRPAGPTGGRSGARSGGTGCPAPLLPASCQAPAAP
jgi:alkanesulfonate monooxygenase SsuD/methylene tetrahydromethanopterin reductase-like flavin-dependent oxidoreductase (luciferase family)